MNILEKDTSKRGRDLIRTHREPQFELFYFSGFFVFTLNSRHACFAFLWLCYVMLSTETTTGFKLLEYFDLQRYPAQMCTVCFTLTICFKDRLVEGAY